MISPMQASCGKSTIASALYSLRETLPPSESRVARNLLDGYPLAGIGTLAEIAAKARVSSPTVLRLVNRLGFTSFSDFQRALLSEIEARLATTASLMPYEPAPRSGHLVADILREAAASVAADAEALATKEVDGVLDLLSKGSRSITTMGGWLTQVFAHYLCVQLQTMRPRCRFLGTAVSDNMPDLADLGKRDTVVIFDCRPYSRASHQVCSWVRRRGVRVALCTDEWLSPISRNASYVLVARGASSSPFDSYASLFALTEAVVAGVAARLGDDVRHRVAQTEALLESWEWRPGNWTDE